MSVEAGTPEDRSTEVVLRVLAGKSEALPLASALRLITAIDAPAAQRAGLVGGLLRSAPVPAIRSGAAIALRRLGTAEARDELRTALAGEPDDSVMSHIATGLGIIGSQEDIELLKSALGRTRDHLARPRVAFAAALIAHRLSLAGPDLDMPPLEARLQPGDETVPVTVGELTEEEVLLVLEGLRQEPVGFSHEASLFFKIMCGKRPVYLVLNPEFANSPGQLHGRKGLLGAVFEVFEEPPRTSPAMLVLSMPSLDGFDLLVTRMRGESLYRGVGTSEGTLVSGGLWTVDTIGVAAAEITFELNRSMLHVEGVVERAVRRHLQPHPANGA